MRQAHRTNSVEDREWAVGGPRSPPRLLGSRRAGNKGTSSRDAEWHAGEGWAAPQSADSRGIESRRRGVSGSRFQDRTVGEIRIACLEGLSATIMPCRAHALDINDPALANLAADCFIELASCFWTRSRGRETASIWKVTGAVHELLGELGIQPRARRKPPHTVPPSSPASSCNSLPPAMRFWSSSMVMPALAWVPIVLPRLSTVKRSPTA